MDGSQELCAFAQKRAVAAQISFEEIAKEKKEELGTVVHTCNPSTWEVVRG
jgi:hypothetical protein